MIGPTGVWVVQGAYSWSATAVWMTRNTASILLIGAAGVRLGKALQTWWSASPRPSLRAQWAAVPRRRQAEYVSLTALSAVVYSAVFGLNHELPLAFALIAMTMWAGLRLHTTFVIMHDLVFGSVAVLFTLHGAGVFAAIACHAARALVAQVFVGMIAVVGLALALGRDEREELIDRLSTAEQAAPGRPDDGRHRRLDGEGLTVVDGRAFPATQPGRPRPHGRPASPGPTAGQTRTSTGCSTSTARR